MLWKGRSNANTSYIAATHGHGSSREIGESENQNIIGHQCENSNISLPLSNLDLHMYATRSLEDGSANDPTGVESPSQDHFEMPGCLPNYEPVSMPSSVYWGRKSDQAEIRLNTIAIAKAYNEVTTWRKNTFLVPYGKIGRDFIDQVAKHNNDWNNISEMHHIAVTAAIVLLALALKVEDWVDQVAKLAEFTAANPRASYATFTIGLKHRWTYYLRTLPDIEELQEPLERAIGNVLIPAMTGHTCTPAER